MVPIVKVAMPPEDRLMPALEEVLYSGMIGEGEQVYAFERVFSEKFSFKHVLATSSGTGALHIALQLAGVTEGCEVITTSMTAEPTNTTIVNAGGVPVFSDVDPANGNITPRSIREKITDRTVAICIVHYAGYPVDIKGIKEIAEEFDLILIEDCAHALGATVGDQFVGSLGDFAIFSFQAIKHITTGDGGMLVLKNGELVPRAKRLRWFGLTKGVPRERANITEVGHKYNMNNVAATIGLLQLERADEIVVAHQRNGLFFDEQFSKIDGVAAATNYKGSSASYWLYTLLSDKAHLIQEALVNNGIQASKVHKPNHLHSVFNTKGNHLPNLDQFYRRLVHLPCGWWLESKDRELIVEIIRKTVK